MKKGYLFFALFAVLIALVAVLIAIHYRGGGRVLYLATTTSVKDAGLLDVLIPKFEEYMRSRGYNVEVRYSAVGTGMALRMAERGDVDLVLVHSPELERRYLEEGVLKCRSIVAYNYFVLVGPLEDPANVSGMDILNAFKNIALAGEEGRAYFISRGDLSGTHMKELEVWERLNISPIPGKDRWYVSTGSGMEQTLLMANEMRGYTLTDTGTWAKLEGSGRLFNLKVVVSSDMSLLNLYSVAIVRDDPIAREFARFLLGEEGQRIIGELKVDGLNLFIPISGAEEGVLEYIRREGLDFGSPCW